MITFKQARQACPHQGLQSKERETTTKNTNSYSTCSFSGCSFKLPKQTQGVLEFIKPLKEVSNHFKSLNMVRQSMNVIVEKNRIISL